MLVASADTTTKDFRLPFWTPPGFVFDLPPAVLTTIPSLVAAAQTKERELRNTGKFPLLDPACLFGEFSFGKIDIRCYLHGDSRSRGWTINKVDVAAELERLRAVDALSGGSEFAGGFLKSYSLTPDAMEDTCRYLVFQRADENIDLILQHELRHVLAEDDPTLAEPKKILLSIIQAAQDGFEKEWREEEQAREALISKRDQILGAGAQAGSAELRDLDRAIESAHNANFGRNRALSLFATRLTPEEFAMRLGTLVDAIRKGLAAPEKAELAANLGAWLSIAEDISFLRSAPAALAPDFSGTYSYFSELADMLTQEKNYLRRLNTFQRLGGRLHPFFEEQRDRLVSAIRSVTAEALRISAGLESR